MVTCAYAVASSGHSILKATTFMWPDQGEKNIKRIIRDWDTNKSNQ